MRNQKGITLTSLVIYVIAMIIVLALMSSIINNFYQNSDTIQADTQEIIEFNNFNTYFLKEIKKKENRVDSIQDNYYILFASGNSFSLENNSIYYNNIEICRDVKEFVVQQGLEGDGKDNTVVFVKISFEKFSKSINYKIEEIY